MPTVKTDKDLLRRILVNLLSNAIKFSPKQSIVSVQVTQAHCASLTFKIVDQGPGIPPNLKKHLFNEFLQASNNKVRGVVGSGLGLSFCKLAVEAMGGRIWIESSEGKGTTVAFTLPNR